MKNIAIITARGGSKRIPHKNIKEFCGKPILAYSIEAAIASGAFDTVMVSTDDEEIAKIAKEYGAEVPFMRSEENANDFSSTKDVILEVLCEYQKLGVSYDALCCIYPTAPFITKERLLEAMDSLAASEAGSIMPVVPFSFPIQRGVILKDDYLAFRQPEHRLTRSQDLEPVYHDAGQFYCIKVPVFLEEQQVVTSKCKPLILSELEVQDIDNETDWKLAELKYNLLHS